MLFIPIIILNFTADSGFLLFSGPFEAPGESLAAEIRRLIAAG